MSDNATPPQATGISSLPPEILQSHILTLLDGQTLASATCVSTSLAAGEHYHLLWSNLCNSTWPSTAGDRLCNIISTFSGDQNGPQSFFSHSYPLPSPDPTTVTPQSSPSSPSPANELISAVDVYFRNKPILSKTEETETTTDWFPWSPFRIEVLDLDPKLGVPTPVPYPTGDDMCTALMEDMSLSWILIDPVSKRAVNLSSYKPVSVHRIWLSGEVRVCFVSILASDAVGALVQCGIVVKCREMQVREVAMEVKDMDGIHLNGRDSLVILQSALEGKRGSGVKREEEARRRHERFEEMKRERRERKLRVEWTLDTLSLAFGLSVFVSLIFVFF